MMEIGNINAVHAQTFRQQATGLQLGHRLAGKRAGPSVLVLAHAPMADILFQRIAALPTIPWMRGTLYLVAHEALDTIHACNDMDDVVIDQSLVLPFPQSFQSQEAAVIQGYHEILRFCAALGMIEGRGVRPAPRT